MAVEPFLIHPESKESVSCIAFSHVQSSFSGCCIYTDKQTINNQCVQLFQTSMLIIDEITLDARYAIVNRCIDSCLRIVCVNIFLCKLYGNKIKKVYEKYLCVCC